MKKLAKLHRKVLRGVTQCADLMFDLNQECVAAGQAKQALYLRGVTCYYCEVLGTTEENLKANLKRKEK